MVMTVCAAGEVSGPTYPAKPIRIVTSDVGGNNDMAARLIANSLTDTMGQPVIVDNRGGNVIFAVQIVAKAPPTGYTLLLHGSSFWLTPFLRRDVGYDPIRDFSPITSVTRSPTVLVVNPALPVKSTKDLIALAKAKPGELNFGTGITGASAHLAAELFKAMADINIVRVAYKSAGPALNDLVSNQIQMMFPNGASVASHLKSGRLRALAVTSVQPSPLFPGLPTVAASGLPGYEASSINGMFVPKGTPGSLVGLLNQEVVKLVNRADIREKFFNSGVETVGSSAAELAATMASEMARLGKVIKDAGIREE